MSKFDGEIRAQGEAIVLDEVLVALGHLPRAAAARTGALAAYLAGGEGWRDAREALHGTFSPGIAGTTGLIGSSDT